MAKLEKIVFNPEGEEPVEFFVLEQTRIGGMNYILVTDFEEGDGEALILKDISKDGDFHARLSPNPPHCRIVPFYKTALKVLLRQSSALYF